MKKDKFLLGIIYFSISFLFLRNILWKSGGIGFCHDWRIPYLSEQLKQMGISIIFCWLPHNLGKVSLYPFEFPIRLIYGLLGYLGINGYIVSKTFLLVIIMVSGLTMYLLCRSLNIRFVFAFISGIFYMSTPVIFNKIIAGHDNYWIGYALFPLSIFFLNKIFQNGGRRELILTALIVSLMFCQFHYGLMFFFVFIGYIIFFNAISFRKKIKILFTICSIIFLLQIPSILMIIINFSASMNLIKSVNFETLQILSTKLIHAFFLTGYVSKYFLSILNTFALKSFWLIAAICFTIFAFGSAIFRSKCRTNFLYIILSIILIFLIKGLNPPLVHISKVVFSKIYFLKVFRESYHLMGLLAFIYGILSALFMEKVTTLLSKKSYKKEKLFIFLCVIITIIYISPFLFGNLGNTLQIYEIDNTQKNCIDKFLKISKDFRVLYLPFTQPFKYENLNKFGIDIMIEYSEKPTIGNYISSDFIKWLAYKLHTPFSNLNEIQNILSLLSIKYIFFRFNYHSMLPKYSIEGKFIKIGNKLVDISNIWNNKNLFYTVSHQKNFSLIEKTQKTIIFKNFSFLPHVYYSFPNIFNNFSFFMKKPNFKLSKLTLSSSLPILTFRRINPTKYEIKIENATDSFFLIFSETYHPKWKAYIETNNEQNKEKWKIIANYPKLHVKEAKHDWYKFTPQDIKYLFKKPLPEKYHFLVNGYANAWYIDPKEIGSSNFTITLYFWPQSLFYLGLFISGLTFLGCVGYLGYDFWKEKRSGK